MKGATPPQARMLRGQALDQLVDDALLRHEANRLGLDVSDQDVLNAITTMPELQRDGTFDRDLLERVLEVQRDRGEFEAQVRQDLVNRRVRALVVDGVQVSDEEVAERFGQDREQIDLLYVRIPADELAKTAKVSDEEVAKWVADHPDRYRTPPRVRVRYVAYSPKDFVTLATPSEDAVHAYYDSHRDDRFTVPEQIHARHILIKLAPDANEQARAEARKKAEDVLTEVKAGSDFAGLAKKYSQDPGSATKGGDLGLFARGSDGAGVRGGGVRARAGHGERHRGDALRLPHHQGGGEGARRPQAVRVGARRDREDPHRGEGPRAGPAAGGVRPARRRAWQEPGRGRRQPVEGDATLRGHR